jgi:Galactose oxidase, central domain/Kelch motif
MSGSGAPRLGRVSFVLLIAASVLAGSFAGNIIAAELGGAWTSAAPMSVPRMGQTTTLLQDGRVLVTGGDSQSPSAEASAELYSPATNTWTAAASMSAARMYHTATLLLDGRVLVAGGCGSGTPCDAVLSSAEIYDPRTALWSTTAPLASPRLFHTATLLRDGRVLVLGGCVSDPCREGLSSAEIFNPGSGSWSSAGNMAQGRLFPSASLLPDGRVLVAGGCTFDLCSNPFSSAELFEPSSSTWSPAGDLSVARFLHSATVLADGRVLVAGGLAAPDTALASAELFDPASGSWSPTGSMSGTRECHAAVRLTDGRVLASAGYSGGFLVSTEIYDPATGQWTAVEDLGVGRDCPGSVLLQDGRVLFAGGIGSPNNPLASVELYAPAGP